MIESKGNYQSSKILDENQIIERISKLRTEQMKIGLCVGGYDLLHPGHMTHLRSAKNLCDVLIVAVTCDKFNSKRKGDGRPIYDEKLRAYAISQLEQVDYVFVSNYERAVEAIVKLKPTYFIKGPDFINKQTPGIIAEREAIASVGGEIKYTDDEKLSTTQIIDYIKSNIK